MSAPKFAIGMLFVLAIAAVWSILDSAPWTTVLLRIVICAVVLQAGYFLVVLGMVARERKRAERAPSPKKVESEPQTKVGESNLSR
jgi:exopolysaccharide production repressor protein